MTIQFQKRLTEKVTVILSIIVILLLFANIVPIIQTVANDLASLPLGNIFSNGVVLILIMIGLMIIIFNLIFGDRR